MAKLIIKDRKLCIVNNHFVTDADGAPCVCQGGVCANAPDRVKLTLSGRFDLDWKRTTNPGTDEESYIRESHRVTFPQFEITLRKVPDAFSTYPSYVFDIDCDIPMSGFAIRMRDDNGFGALTVGWVNKVVSVSFGTRPIDFFDQDSPCVLGGIGIMCLGKYDDGSDGDPADLFLNYSGIYESLESDLIGSHPEFGQRLDPDFNGLSNVATVTTGKSGAFDSRCFNPPTFLDIDPIGQNPPRFYETSCSSFQIDIEEHQGDTICEFNPFVKALKCDGSGPEITVDLRDALPDAQSSPLFNNEIYQPTGQPGVAPADTDVWIEEVCDEIEQYRVYQLCDDPDDTILVDETDKPQDALTALVGTLRYTPTPTLLIGDPVAVVWDTNACPNPGDDQLWERCRPGQLFFTPSGFLPPNRVRFVNDINSFDVAEATVKSPDYQTGSQICNDFAFVYYRRIVDDGGVYPTIGAATGVPGQCGSYQDRFIRNVCRFTGDGGFPGEPTDPNAPAITQPGTRSRLPIVDLDGFDTDAELRRQRNGGCCGQGV